MGEDLEYRIKALEEDSRRNQATHKEFFARLENLNTEYTRIDTQYANIMATLVKVQTDIEELKTKPSRRWETIVDKAIWAVLAAVIAFLLARIGL